VVSPSQVGRGRELSRLVSAVSAPPAVAVVEGEAGIGKTRLVTELRARLREQGRWSVAGWCRQIREPFPLGPVIDAVRVLGAELAGAPLSPVAGALRPLLPELAGLLPPQPPALDDRMAERHRVFRALVEVLGSRGPVVLVLEDLHWADEQTTDFVSYLLADPPPELSLVLTFRGEDVAAAVRALTAKLPAPVTAIHQQLTLLDRRQTGELAGAILGSDRVSTEFAGYLHARTSGLPFAVEELLALLRVRGALARRSGSWPRRVLQRLDVPTGIRDSVLARVASLTADARSVVEAAAVLQAPVPAAVLTGTVRAPAARVQQGLLEALEAGLLAEDAGGERVGFRHLLAAQAVYDATQATRRRQLHGRAATGLAAVEPAPLGQLAHHLRHAGRLAEWVRAAERAADQAAELGHHDEAVQLLADVLRHAPLRTRQRGRLALKLARTANETLHARDVRNLLLSVPTGDLPRRLRSELRFWLALLLDQTGGDPVRRRRLLAEAVEELTDRPDLRAWAMVGLAIPTVAPGVPPAAHLPWLRRSLELVPELTDPALAVLVLGKVAMVQAAVGDPQWRQVTDRMLARTGAGPGQPREVSAFESVGVDACYAGHHQTAGRLLTAALAGAGTDRLERRSRAGLALLDYCRGHWDGLAERAERLVDELADYPQGRVNAEVVAGGLALARGELDLAWRRLNRLRQAVERAGGFDLLPLPAAALVRLGIARGDLAPGLATGQRVLAGAEATGVWPSTARLLPPLTQAMVAAGQATDAGALVERLAGRLRDLDAPLARAALPHARGFVAAGDQRWREAADLFLTAADRYQPLPGPYEAAQAREQAAASLFAAGVGKARAEQPLRAALATYRRLGATWDAARATGLARRHGLALPAAHRRGRRGYGDDLSPREREVAHLAAAGRTNEQIARDLFLSPKTVDKHVGAALRKLGLRSRRSLAHRLGAAPIS
jgi:DNA-binding CsgD family transcriptional regulator